MVTPNLVLFHHGLEQAPELVAPLVAALFTLSESEIADGACRLSA